MRLLFLYWFVAVAVVAGATLAATIKFFSLKQEFARYMAMFCLGCFGEVACALLNTAVGPTGQVFPAKMILPLIGRSMQGTAAVMLVLYLYFVIGNKPPNVQQPTLP